MVEKTARVQSNDPTNPSVVLTIKGTVKQLIELDPAFLSIRASKGEAVEGKVTLVNHDRSPLEILDVKSANQEFTTKLKTLQKGQRYELIVKLHPQAETGRVNTTLTVLTNNKKSPQVLIPVLVTIAARVEASPDKLIFGKIDRAAMEKNPRSGNSLHRSIIVRSQEKGFKVTKVESTLPFVQLELVSPAQQGLPYNVKVALVKEKLKKGPFNGMVIVRTNDKEFAELKIPLTGEVN